MLKRVRDLENRIKWPNDYLFGILEGDDRIGKERYLKI